MANHLENLCEKKGIKVEFISNKFIDDASEFVHGKPVIKVHKIFKECPMKVAAAVVEIFTTQDFTSEFIGIIESYLKEKFGPIGIKIKPPKVTIISTFKKEVNNDYKEKKENHYHKEELYIEAEISSMDVTNMKGQHKNLDKSETLRAKSEDILELNIVVTPPLHK